ncbi:MAG: NAD-dependent epimerase/dehydratase family protein [Myxococcales bacterium]|nr:NAD-dependent epimerase/dehydratase family protein [Myxococcales bacterium]
MRVLIPGISGLLGQRVAVRLVELGHEVQGIDRRRWAEAPGGIEVHNVDIRKRAAEDVFRRFRPEAVIHMATVSHFAARGEERYRINIHGTRAVFEHCTTYEAKHCIFVGRHTYYGAAADSPLYHSEDEPPMGLANFPELADLVAADLYAGSALWRRPELTTAVLRFCYTLGPSGHGTLATFLRGPRVPTIFGFDPLYQFMHERDVVGSLVAALETRLRGVYNVAGPQPVPLSVLVRETGRREVSLPEFVFAKSLGRFGLPKLPRGALDHIKYGIVMDATPFHEATGFQHEVDEVQCMREFSQAFPVDHR